MRYNGWRLGSELFVEICDLRNVHVGKKNINALTSREEMHVVESSADGFNRENLFASR